jgi:hypothetical protein
MREIEMKELLRKQYEAMRQQAVSGIWPSELFTPVPYADEPSSTEDKEAELARLHAQEEEQRRQEEERWQCRDAELAAITVDRSCPFIGAGDVRWMLKRKAKEQTP